MDECERLTYVSGEAACNAVDIATALGGGFHVSFPPGRGTMTSRCLFRSATPLLVL